MQLHTGRDILSCVARVGEPMSSTQRRLSFVSYSFTRGRQTQTLRESERKQDRLVNDKPNILSLSYDLGR